MRGPGNHAMIHHMRIGCVSMAIIVAHSVSAQDSVVVKGPLSFSVGMSANYGFIIAHSEKVQGTSNSDPTGLTASFNWQRTGREEFDLYGLQPRHSLQIAYYNMNNNALGKGVNVSYALMPHFMVSNRLSLYPKFAAGLGFFSNPHDSITNPTNKAYSLPVNVYLSLGVGFRYQFSKHWAVNVAAEFQHISNGGLYKPNIGINFPTLGAGVEFSPRGLQLVRYQGWVRGKESHGRRFDIQLFGVIKYGDFTGTGSYYPINGINLTHSWQVSRINGWTAAIEVYQDHYMQEHDNAGGVITDPTRVGILAGHEFLLGRFIFSQQLGLYLTDSNHKDMVYHRWGLQYFFLPKWSVGFNLLVHRQTADFTDLRLTYSIFRER